MMRQVFDKVTELGAGGIASLDTTLVLFFLALEYGRAVQMVSVDGALMATTTLMILVLPYFLPSNRSNATFSDWIIGRGLIAVVGLSLGYAFRLDPGIGFAGRLRLAPMTFLILASMVSCYIQFYGLMKLRLAK